MQLNNIIVPCVHFAESTAFFEEVLSLNLTQAGDTFSWFKSGTTNLMLIAAPDSVDAIGSEVAAGMHLEFVVEDAATLMAELAEHSIDLEIASGNAYGIRTITIREPSGYRVDFVERG